MHKTNAHFMDQLMHDSVCAWILERYIYMLTNALSVAGKK